MSFFSQHTSGGKVGWSQQNINDFRRHLKNEFYESHERGGLLHRDMADKFVDQLLAKYEGTTKLGPAGGINEHEFRRDLWELANNQSDGITRAQAAEIEKIVFNDNKGITPS